MKCMRKFSFVFSTLVLLTGCKDSEQSEKFIGVWENKNTTYDIVSRYEFIKNEEGDFKMLQSVNGKNPKVILATPEKGAMKLGTGTRIIMDDSGDIFVEGTNKKFHKVK